MSGCRKRLPVLIKKGEFICHCDFLNRNFCLKKGKLSVVKTWGMCMCVPKMSVRKQNKKTIWLTCQQRMQAFKLQLGDVLPGTCCLNESKFWQGTMLQNKQLKKALCPNGTVVNWHMTMFCYLAMSTLQEWECSLLKWFQKHVQSQLTELIRKMHGLCDMHRTIVREAKTASTWLKKISQKLCIFCSTVHWSAVVCVSAKWEQHFTLEVQGVLTMHKGVLV